MRREVSRLLRSCACAVLLGCAAHRGDEAGNLSAPAAAGSGGAMEMSQAGTGAQPVAGAAGVGRAGSDATPMSGGQGGATMHADDGGPTNVPDDAVDTCPFASEQPQVDSSCGAGDEAGETALDVRLHLNQVGFDAARPKHAVVEASGPLSRFQVLDALGAPIHCGALEQVAFSEWQGGPDYYTVVFDGLRQPGTYRLQVGGARSEPFEVQDGLLFARLVPLLLDYFRSARADDPDVWAAEQAVPFEGSEERRDVRGGWYDASGDISKYLSHLGYANFFNPQQIPLVAWALAWLHDERGAHLPGGMAADVRDEALWGADYLHRVLDPAGYFYLDVFDGWSGDLGARTICAFVGESGTRTRDYQAAFREGGGMAVAALARIAAWGQAGSFAAAQYLDDAERAFAHLQTHGTDYCDDGIENVIDDYAALLAASELFAATQDAQYLAAARERAAALAARLHPDGYFIADAGSRPFWHASDAGLPAVALARYAALETDAAMRAAALHTLGAHLRYLLDVTREVANPFGYARQHVNTGGGVRSSFFIPHDNETGYWWQGENARLGSLAAAAELGGRAVCPGTQPGAASLPFELAGYAADQIDWVLGKNPFDLGFIAGIGRNHPPAYSASKPQQGHHDGGIANGITGRNDDGSGIRWLSDDAPDSWTQWRWVEQWLPHAAWYLVAVGAASRE
jgi:hypothetical protein